MLFGQHFDGELPWNLNHVLLRQFKTVATKKLARLVQKSKRRSHLNKDVIFYVRTKRVSLYIPHTVIFRARKIGRHPAICDQKVPFGEWKNPFSRQFGDWKLPFSGQVGDQTFFQSGQRRCGPDVIVQGTWQSLSVEDARDCGQFVPIIVFASKSNPGIKVPSLRFSFWDHLSFVGRRKYCTRYDCQFARHISLVIHESFSVRVWAEKVPQCIGRD